jgi:hypothetical protein
MAFTTLPSRIQFYTRNLPDASEEIYAPLVGKADWIVESVWHTEPNRSQLVDLNHIMQVNSSGPDWCARQELNLRPTGSKAEIGSIHKSLILRLVNRFF